MTIKAPLRLISAQEQAQRKKNAAPWRGRQFTTHAVQSFFAGHRPTPAT
jgi:hypothetical protein